MGTLGSWQSTVLGTGVQPSSLGAATVGSFLFLGLKDGVAGEGQWPCVLTAEGPAGGAVSVGARPRVLAGP